MALGDDPASMMDRKMSHQIHGLGEGPDHLEIDQPIFPFADVDRELLGMIAQVFRG